MKSVVGDHFRANLRVLNLGPSAVSSKDAAYIADVLVRPAAVRDARQRGGHYGRQAATQFTNRGVRVARERAAGLPCAERQDPAVPWRRQVRRTLIAPAGSPSVGGR